MTADLRLGRWQDVLADVEEWDACIFDAPYSERTHSGHRVGVEGSRHYMRTDKRTGAVYSSGSPKRRDITYSSMSPEEVREACDSLCPRTKGWMVSMTDHVLAPHWASSMQAHGRYVFAPLPIVIPGMTVRLTGDGPSSWTIQVVVSRPASLRSWGTLPGAYIAPRDVGQHIGGKPLSVMRAVVRDYTRPGSLVVDPFAGLATTLLAAECEGRRAIGAEMDPDTYAKAKARLERGHTPDMFSGGM